jgi:hypothetical protein
MTIGYDSDGGTWVDPGRISVRTPDGARRVLDTMARIQRGDLDMRSRYHASTPPWERDTIGERFGLDEPPVGTVLRWTPSGDGAHPQVAIRVSETEWMISGRSRDDTDWGTVGRRIGDAPCWVATDWREIPRPEPEPAGDEAVKDWAARFLPVSESQVVESGDA